MIPLEQVGASLLLSIRAVASAKEARGHDYETVGILPLISRKTLGILGDGGAGEAAVGGGAWRGR